MAKGRKIVKTRKNKSKKRINMKGGNKTQKERARGKREQREFHQKIINESRASKKNKNGQGNNSPSKPGQNKNGSNNNSSINETNNKSSNNESNHPEPNNNRNRNNNEPPMQSLGPGPTRGPPGSAVTGLAGVVAAVGLFSLVYMSINK